MYLNHPCVLHVSLSSSSFDRRNIWWMVQWKDEQTLELQVRQGIVFQKVPAVYTLWEKWNFNREEQGKSKPEAVTMKLKSTSRDQMI
jgi:hypothetical protein